MSCKKNNCFHDKLRILELIYRAQTLREVTLHNIFTQTKLTTFLQVNSHLFGVSYFQVCRESCPWSFHLVGSAVALSRSEIHERMVHNI